MADSHSLEAAAAATSNPSKTLSGALEARREGLVFAALVVIAFALTLYWCFPGYMARDSGTQLEQARSFEFWDDHPVLMALIWHYLDQVLPGPFGMLAFMSALCWAGLGTLFWALPGPLALRVAGFVAVAVFPPYFSVLPIVVKDALMHGGLLLGLGLLVMPSRRGWLARAAGALVCFSIALGARHNGAAAAWPFLVLPLLRTRIWGSQPHWLRLVAASAVAIVATYALTRTIDAALAPLAHRTEFWQTVPVYDLAGMSVESGECLVEPETSVLAEGMGLPEIEQVFDITYGNRLYYCIPFQGQDCVNVFHRTLEPAELQQLSANWLRAIRRHPGAYLRHRLHFSAELLNVTATKPVFYLDGQPHHELAKDYPLPERTLGLLTRLEKRIHWVGYRPWLYVLLSALLLPLGLIAYLRGRSVLPLLYVLSGLSYLLSILMAAMTIDFRYTAWTILVSVLALLTLIAMRVGGSSRSLTPP